MTTPREVQILMSEEKHELIARILGFIVKNREDRAETRVLVSHAESAQWRTERQLKELKSTLETVEHERDKARQKLHDTRLVVEIMKNINPSHTENYNVILDRINHT